MNSVLCPRNSPPLLLEIQPHFRYNGTSKLKLPLENPAIAPFYAPRRGEKEPNVRNPMILVTIALLLSTSIAAAGQIHPALETRLDEARDDEAISVIVIMAEQAPVAELNEQLKVERSTLATRHAVVVEALKLAARSQEPLKEYLDVRVAAGSVRGYTSHWISNLIVLSATKDEIEIIAHHPDVDYVELNFKPELIEPVRRPDRASLGEAGSPSRSIGITPGLEAIRAPEVWHTLGFTGAGRLIGSCDTGVDGSHPALTSRWRGNTEPWQECWLDVLGTGTTYPTDTHSHGTHTTGTMTGVAPDDTIGVAWGAEWIATNVINQGVGSGFDNDVIACYEWFADPDGNPGTTDDVPDVVQNSWRINEGFGGDYTDCDSRWWAVIDGAEAAGVVTCWSAGNEGSGAQTIGSPADRATTLTNAFSVGAVDATNYGWPYPIAYFSSRGPSGCVAPADHKIKPEVVAPGVDVYSSVPGGGYEGGWDGTSMSGPHVAGVVALMREANPNLDVDTIKEIIMATALDEGTTGEDNTFGHGFIDAYDAVLAATVGFGNIEGVVRNQSYGSAPIPGALVELVGSTFDWTTESDGSYAGAAEAGSYTAQASRAGFSTQSFPVDLVAGEILVQNFDLQDIAGPEISNVSQPGSSTDASGPYPIRADIVDLSTVVSATLFYRVNGGSWVPTAMASAGGDTYEAFIPGMPSNTEIDYYVHAVDGAAIEAVSPAGAPNEFYSLYITHEVYSYDVEDPEDTDWQLGVAGDGATGGVWVRVDPVSTWYGNIMVQTENDHTEDPGTLCFVTGNAPPGGHSGLEDVDGGCTTLMSPVFNLSGSETAFVNYWRWYAEAGAAIDDEFAVDVSDDGGASWAALERVESMANEWTEVSVDLTTLIDMTDQVVFRFVACDLNVEGLVEAAIDDFQIVSYSNTATAVADAETVHRPVSLMKSRPNPFRPGAGSVTIRFALPKTEHAEVKIFDISGRLVRDLADRSFTAGEHRVGWDGRDSQGNEVSSGVYFYRLKTDTVQRSERMTVLR